MRGVRALEHSNWCSSVHRSNHDTVPVSLQKCLKVCKFHLHITLQKSEHFKTDLCEFFDNFLWTYVTLPHQITPLLISHYCCCFFARQLQGPFLYPVLKNIPLPMMQLYLITWWLFCLFLAPAAFLLVQSGQLLTYPLSLTLSLLWIIFPFLSTFFSAPPQVVATKGGREVDITRRKALLLPKGEGKIDVTSEEREWDRWDEWMTHHCWDLANREVKSKMKNRVNRNNYGKKLQQQEGKILN